MTITTKVTAITTDPIPDLEVRPAGGVYEEVGQGSRLRALWLIGAVTPDGSAPPTVQSREPEAAAAFFYVSSSSVTSPRLSA